MLCVRCRKKLRILTGRCRKNCSKKKMQPGTKRMPKDGVGVEDEEGDGEEAVDAAEQQRRLKRSQQMRNTASSLPSRLKRMLLAVWVQRLCIILLLLLIQVRKMSLHRTRSHQSQ